MSLGPRTFSARVGKFVWKGCEEVGLRTQCGKGRMRSEVVGNAVQLSLYVKHVYDGGVGILPVLHLGRVVGRNLHATRAGEEVCGVGVKDEKKRGDVREEERRRERRREKSEESIG